ncbi:thermonuclease family protein [Mangrovicoccus sp. HB161399]|uniref:thermonuclease family protein n=1 Tax=Mangrovicoccus sp. HB161399 TaxID=2720392 RepID=UPI0020A6BB84|nr:thermonuclease family protein [Mangrovicoccus sp. HB161399]
MLGWFRKIFTNRRLPDRVPPPEPAVRPAESAFSRQDMRPAGTTAPPPPARPEAPPFEPVPETLKGRCYVIDGDTIVIGKTHVRLAGIDAPEMDQPYGRKAKTAMIALCRGHVVTAELEDHGSYGRVVAKCFLPDGTDLSAALVEQGLALDWPKFSGGAYRHLEPAGVRRKLWRVDAKHRGKLRMPEK